MSTNRTFLLSAEQKCDVIEDELYVPAKIQASVFKRDQKKNDLFVLEIFDIIIYIHIHRNISQ